MALSRRSREISTAKRTGSHSSLPAVRRDGPIIPTERSKPSPNLMDYTWLIYGDKGIGKTSLAAQMDSDGEGKVLFAMFEPGGRALSIFKTDTITDWGFFRDIVSALQADRQGYNTIVIDPGSTAYQRCLEWVCKSLNIVHPGMVKDYGASWSQVNTEFQQLHSQIASLGMGFIVLAHDKEAERERRSGATYTKTVPVMSGSTEEFYAGIVDVIAHYEYRGKERFLRIRGDEDCEAKCRLDHAFLTPGGARIVRIPMGSNPREGFRNLKTAFQNKQTQTFADV